MYVPPLHSTRPVAPSRHGGGGPLHSATEIAKISFAPLPKVLDTLRRGCGGGGEYDSPRMRDNKGRTTIMRMNSMGQGQTHLALQHGLNSGGVEYIQPIIVQRPVVQLVRPYESWQRRSPEPRRTRQRRRDLLHKGGGREYMNQGRRYHQGPYRHRLHQ